MLNRNDLVKQFEIVVKQEIKNHNDSILATNIALNSLTKKLDDLKLETASSLVQLSSRVYERKVQLEQIQDKFSEEQQVLKNNISSFRKSLEDLRNELIYFFSNKIENFVFNDQIIELKTFIINELQSIYCKFQERESHHLFDFKKLHDEIKMLQKTIDEFASFEKKEHEKISENLSKKIEENKIDKDGLMRELEILKKRVFVQEKEIEDLYTLVDRLKQKP